MTIRRESDKLHCGNDVQEKKLGALFVDDEAHVLRALRRSFSQADFAVATEGNAAKGPAAMGASDLDLLADEFRMLEIERIQFPNAVKERYRTIDTIDRVLLRLS